MQQPCLHRNKPELRRPKEGLHNPRSGLCLRFLQRLHDHAHGRFLVESFAVAGHHGHVPVVLRVRLNHLFSLVHAHIETGEFATHQVVAQRLLNRWVRG